MTSDLRTRRIEPLRSITIIRASRELQNGGGGDGIGGGNGGGGEQILDVS